MRRARIIGPGRAGLSFAAALDQAGWAVVEVAGRGVDVSGFARDVDLVLISVADDSVADVAATIGAGPAVVAHVAGSLGLDALEGHERRASIHPLLSLPDARTGAARLLGGGWFAVAGDPLAPRVVEDLGGRWFEVADEDRAAYHAAASIAANHLVALLGQVERLALATGVPFEAFLDLAQGALDSTRQLGPAAALTGPAQRGDLATIQRHLQALPPSERATYEAMMEEARRLTE